MKTPRGFIDESAMRGLFWALVLFGAVGGALAFEGVRWVLNHVSVVIR